jgi:hypothetical protein
MSSFSNPHFMYLFALKNGKRKLAYGQSPEDALEILRIRLSDDEMAQVVPDTYLKINQRELQQYVTDLG